MTLTSNLELQGGDVRMRKSGFGLYLFIGFCLLLAAGTYLGTVYISKIDAIEDNSRVEDDGKSVTTIVAVKLASTSELIVSRLTGKIRITSSADRLWGWMRSSMTASMPLSVAYTVPLAKVRGSDFAWDAKRRLLLIDVPDIVVGDPNIDETKITIENEEGVIVSRSQSNEMRQKISIAAQKRAGDEARSADRMKKVRDRARVELERLFSAPVKSAGYLDVTVQVRFPSDPEFDGERWDVSKSVEEVLANRR
ncbi:DUF4230 domain-containing protein [Sphingomonas qomolangmaensis]|uniref:DUF4230 domain-containing protein n=1 Tax=Sphingomonas qomolangmaensis TaxID=2918765 RepID=A0ABY5LA70_9SPHN|nr:DUF4230 domain-containing protein [Sphingomonas qomolangmaensis]UUL83860.1 DUF4230 domain-containing protein [Sphingomonas qomolangmaensis]